MPQDLLCSTVTVPNNFAVGHNVEYDTDMGSGIHFVHILGKTKNKGYI
jgi:hypothetical protein